MSVRQRYLVHYKSLVPNEPNDTTFGVYAKKYNQAISITRTFIYSQELHNHRTIDYTLTGEPSNKPAKYEIPDEDDEMESASGLTEEKYNISE